MKKTLLQALEEQEKMEEIRTKVEEFTGTNIKDVGRKCSYSVINAKRLFWRICFFYGITGEISSKFTGDKSRFTSLSGRKTHIKLCKQDKGVENEWNIFKKMCKNG